MYFCLREALDPNPFLRYIAGWIRTGSGKAWIGQGGMDDRQQGKAQAILR